MSIGNRFSSVMRRAYYNKGLVEDYLTLPYQFVKSWTNSKWDGEEKFSSLKSYCMFLGYPRSGHSLVGSLLDAHPQIVISHELDALLYYQFGFRRAQLFQLILARDEQFTKGGRRWTGYNYFVPGGSQGKYRDLLVIGDKKGSKTTRRLATNPGLLDLFRKELRIPLRVIHSVRNPFDNIATICRKEHYTLSQAVEKYARLCSANAMIRSKLQKDELFEMKHEEFVTNTQTLLIQLCHFVGVSPEAEFLEACSACVFEVAKQTRHEVLWTKDLVKKVESMISSFEFLEGYSFATESTNHGLPPQIRAAGSSSR